MCEIVFVILHYMTLDDTVECVKSVRDKCGKEKYKIIIVDNASPNNSSKELKRLFEKSEDVDLVLLNENLGFARGNNKGIEVARGKYSPNFIITMNNDVILLQDDTVAKIKNEFNESNFSVLGPMIYTADGRCNDNPGREKPASIEEVKNIILINKKNIFLCKWHLWKPYRLLEIFKEKMFKSKGEIIVNKANKQKCYLKKTYNIQLHGCFLCFSKEYFKYFNGFYPKTFLYMEEDILFYLLSKKNLTTVYVPQLKVYHKEDSATKAQWTSDKERAVKKARLVLESAIEFEKLYQKEDV